MKVNLIVDTNNLFYQNADVTYYANRVGSRFPKTEKKLGSPEALEIFKESINVTFKTICNNFSKVDKIFFVQDSSSWRKKVDIKGEKSYKANRKGKHDDMDWNAWSEGIDWLISSNNKFINIRIDGFEADDLIFLLNQTLLNEDENCINIILSTDGDFKQLLQPRTLIYNPTRNNVRLMFSEDFSLEDIKYMEDNEIPMFEVKKEKSSDPMDFFDVSNISITESNSDVELHKLLQSSLDIEHINNQIGICTKIITGDDKDNVPSSFHWNNKKGNPTRVTPRYVTKIFERFEEEGISINVKNIMKNIHLIQEVLEYEINKTNTKNYFVPVPISELKENLFLNLKLLYLSRQTLPKNLVEKYDKAYNDLKEGKGLFSEIQKQTFKPRYENLL